MYEEFFGFREKPFSLTPNPTYLYPTAGHREALASLLLGIREKRGILVLTGDVGTGKTTLLEAVRADAGDGVSVVSILTPRANFEEILDTLCELLLVPKDREGIGGRIRWLSDALHGVHKAQGNVVLVVDEAQDLSSEVLEDLRLLSNIETPQAKLLQIVLSGQLELDTRLEDPALKALNQRISIRARLKPLTYREMVGYVSHRLKVGGHEGKALFGRGALQILHTFSGGNPRLVNILCENALTLAYARNQLRVDERVMTEVLSDHKGEALVVRRIPGVQIRVRHGWLGRIDQAVRETGVLAVALTAVLVLLLLAPFLPSKLTRIGSRIGASVAPETKERIAPLVPSPAATATRAAPPLTVPTPRADVKAPEETVASPSATAATSAPTPTAVGTVSTPSVRIEIQPEEGTRRTESAVARGSREKDQGPQTAGHAREAQKEESTRARASEEERKILAMEVDAMKDQVDGLVEDLHKTRSELAQMKRGGASGATAGSEPPAGTTASSRLAPSGRSADKSASRSSAQSSGGLPTARATAGDPSGETRLVEAYLARSLEWVDPKPRLEKGEWVYLVGVYTISPGTRPASGITLTFTVRDPSKRPVDSLSAIRILSSEPGIFRAKIWQQVPSDAAPGLYSLVASLDAGGVSEKKVFLFEVR